MYGQSIFQFNFSILGKLYSYLDYLCQRTGIGCKHEERGRGVGVVADDSFCGAVFQSPDSRTEGSSVKKSIGKDDCLVTPPFVR